MDPGAFAEAVGQVARAASKDEARPVLTGVLLEISREGVVLVATDSYRLAVRDLVATADGEAKAIVPERALTEAGRAAVDQKSGVEASVDASQVAFRVGSLTLTSRLIEGEFPNYRQLLPENVESRLTISRQQLLDAVRRVGLLARDTTPVRLEFNALGVKLSSSSPDLGQAVETVEARYEGEDLVVAFNPQYLVDGLTRGHGGERAARRPRRVQAGRDPWRRRRAHVPRDAGPAAGRGQLTFRAIADPDAPGVARAPGFPEPPAHTRWIDLADGLTVVVGPNGEGKTNLLEGMFFLFALRSPRTSTNAPLVREGAEVAYSRGEFAGLEGKLLVEVEIPAPGASRVKVNRSPSGASASSAVRCASVFFGPVRPAGGDRRSLEAPGFMDEAVVALWPLKEGLSTAYERALRQRNRLLKEWEGGRGGPSGMDAWDEELVRTGVPVIGARSEADRPTRPRRVRGVRGARRIRTPPARTPRTSGSDGGGASANSSRSGGPTSCSAEPRSSGRIATTSIWPSATSAPARSARTARRGRRRSVCGSVSPTAVGAETGEPPILLVDDPLQRPRPGPARPDRRNDSRSGAGRS